MRSKTYQLAPGGIVGDGLGFNAYTALVNNAGGQWVHFADSGVYVEPYTLNAVVPVFGSQAPQVDTVPPPTQVNTGTGQPATILFTDQPSPGSPGSSIVGTPAGTATLQGSGSFAAPGPPNGGSAPFTGLIAGAFYELTELIIACIRVGASDGKLLMTLDAQDAAFGQPHNTLWFGPALDPATNTECLIYHPEPYPAILCPANGDLWIALTTNVPSAGMANADALIVFTATLRQRTR
jgi:hypothetical protein